MDKVKKIDKIVEIAKIIKIDQNWPKLIKMDHQSKDRQKRQSTTMIEQKQTKTDKIDQKRPKYRHIRPMERHEVQSKNGDRNHSTLPFKQAVLQVNEKALLKFLGKWERGLLTCFTTGIELIWHM